MNEALVFRPACLDDLPALNAVMEASVRGLFARDYDARQTRGALEHVFRIDPHLIEEGSYEVCESAGRIVASGGWSRRRNPYGNSHVEAAHAPRQISAGARTAVVRAMFVHPRFARRGIGRALLHRAERAAVREGFGTLELLATLTGRKLYLSAGFRVDRVERVELPDGTPLPALRMSKPLPPDACPAPA